MSSVLLMNFLDCARSLGQEPFAATQESVAKFLKDEFKKTGGLFNYNSSIGMLSTLFSGGISADDAEIACRSSGAPAGRKPNGDAIGVVAHYAIAHRSNCYRVPFSAVPVGRLRDQRTAYVGIKAPLVRVEGKNVFVVVPGFRMGHKPQGAEIDVASSIVLANLARDDFEGADFEYLSAGRCAYSGERVFNAYQGRDRTIYSLDEVDHLLDIYVRGLQLALDDGLSANKPSFAGYKVHDPAQDRFL